MILQPDSVYDMYIWVVEWHEVSHCRTEDTGYGIPLIAVRGAADTKYNMQVLTRERESNLVILPPDSVHGMYI